jgi:hypothetical protein
MEAKVDNGAQDIFLSNENGNFECVLDDGSARSWLISKFAGTTSM